MYRRVKIVDTSLVGSKTPKIIKIVDVTSEILDEVGIVGTLRIPYRAFIQKLVKLYMHGRTTVSLKNPSRELIDELTAYGFDVKYSKLTRTFWVEVSDIEELIEVYVLDRGLDEGCLRKIVELLERYDELHII